MPSLLLYDWPGNIRQLSNEIRRAVAMSGDGQTIESTDLAPEILEPWNNRPTTASDPDSSTISVRADQTLEQAICELEQHFIRRALDTAGGRVAEAAQLLGLSRKGLFLKRRRRGLVGE
jgi:transcriptional regulator with PAS, ATPase and Fis domain